MSDLSSLLSKYDVALPRYTSYPTVPFWEPETMNNEAWSREVLSTFQKENGEISLYIHLPYCENLCTFCACNKRITKNHGVEQPYLNAVLKEWKLFRRLFNAPPVLREIHLGGGTPTFFSPEHLHELISAICDDAVIPETHSFSIEVHPNYTRFEHLEKLAALGFNRISLGVQDFDPVVQDLINRHQSVEVTAEVVDWSRQLGYASVNIDLVYGLPGQTLHSVEHTIAQIKKMRPERIAFYSYAHVPWKSKVQRRYTEDDLPKAAEKWGMYQRGRELLMAEGYAAIGMDHFAVEGDALLTARDQGCLHRNFMGYTTTVNKLLIGLGASAIGDAWTAFAQNEKDIDGYLKRMESSAFPIVTGHHLNTEDLALRQNILQLMCTGTTVLDKEQLDPVFLESAMKQLSALAADELVEMKGDRITVTAAGELFIRNIAATLDAGIWRKGKGKEVFSKAI